MGKIKDTSKLQSFNSRAFGVEIEFVAPRNIVGDNNGAYQGARVDAARAIQNKANEILNANIVVGDPNNCEDAVEIVAEGYNHETREHWKIVNDGTARPTQRQIRNGLIGGFELVSPILKGETSMKQLKAILEAMRILGFDVSRHCGLHVHHDVRNWRQELRSNDYSKNEAAMNKISNCITLVQKFENVIYGMLPASRRNGRWCQPLNQTYNSIFHCLNGKANYTKKDKMKFLKKNQKRTTTYPSFQNDRYCGLNFQSMFRIGTIEFRYGAPTLNFEKMSNWIVFTQTFVNMAEAWKTVNSVKEMKLGTKAEVALTFEKMRDTLGLVKRMCQDDFQRKASLWIRKRFDHFNPMD